MLLPRVFHTSTGMMIIEAIARLILFNTSITPTAVGLSQSLAAYMQTTVHAPALSSSSRPLGSPDIINELSPYTALAMLYQPYYQ
jgi:hypothetical protein